MHSEDYSAYSARYTAFLRSGSYPAVSALLSRRNDWSRYAGLVALAGAASSAGYMTTLWLMPMTGAETALIHASVASMAPPPKEVPPAPLPPTAAEVAPPNLALTPRSTRREPATARRAGAIAVPAAKAPQLAGPERYLGPKPEVAPQLMASTPLKRVAAHALDNVAGEPDFDGLHAELEAERVHAREQAERAAAIAPLLVRVPVTAPVRALQPAKVGSAHPQPATLWPLMAAANVDSLQVKGPVGIASVRRGVERLRPALASCYASMAERAGHNHFGRVDVSVVIDEAGRVRAPHVTGGLLPGLDSCLAGVASKLVTSAPDTGRATATLALNFTP
jgi:hypothetical protein